MKDEVFGRLTVLERAESRNHQRYYRCRCACGNEVVVRKSNLTTGNTSSCGCLQRVRVAEANTTHGHHTRDYKSPEYNSWAAMIQRCTNPNAPKYSYYGGRGITVCDEWRSYEEFLADMGTRPPDTSIDRIDGDGNYDPGNCRWATQKEQIANQRHRKVAA